MVFADYNFYSIEFGGNLIPIPDYNRTITKAGAYLDYLTFGRASAELDNNIKMAACAIAELYYIEEFQGGKTAESNDGYSISYDTKKSLDEKLLEAALIYIANSGLCYRGMSLC